MKPNGETSIALMTKAALMLAEANTVQKAKELKNLALTAADWARRKGLGEEHVRYARGYALEAERRMGQLIIAGQIAGQIAKPGNQPNVPNEDIWPAKLKELDISRKESSQAQKLAAVPQEDFEKVKTGEKSFKEAIQEVNKAKIGEPPPLPEGKYRIIYSDPPWLYNSTQHGGKESEHFIHGKGTQETVKDTHYPAQKLEEIKALPIGDIAHKNSVLFLWATSPLIRYAFEVIDAWGFEYKANFVWDKVKHNVGHYNSVRHEFLLIATKGSCLPDSKASEDSVISIERTKHSKKPPFFRDLIDRLYMPPTGKNDRIELYKRGEVPSHWDTWGAEVK